MKTIEDLIEKYPLIFKDYVGNPGRCNWSCPDGWITLVDTLCSSLQWNTDKNNSDGRYPQVECSQVKEKFGGLRFYTNGATEGQYGAIYFAESLSYRICMVCGSMKNVKQINGGWIETL